MTSNKIVNNVLRLNVKKKWYDLLKSGAKNIEYRRNVPHWRTRIKNRLPLKEIHFYCGYPPRGTKPLIREVAFVDMTGKSIKIYLEDLT